MKIIRYIMLVIVLSAFALPAMAASSGGTVTRSLSASTIAPDTTVTITITPVDLPSGAFYTYETIPAGFTFVSTTAVRYSNVGNVYTLKQSDATVFTYTIKAPAGTGTYAISGTFKDIDLNTGTIGGANQITVGTASVGTVTRSFSVSTVASGATVTITITPANLPAGVYYTYETIPAGFTFLSTTAFGYSNIGNVYTFKQNYAIPFTYNLKAPATTGTYTFSGTFKDVDLNTGTVGGANQITVTLTPTPVPGATSMQPRIWSADKAPAVPYIWNSLNFDGFYYDIKYDRSTETLTLNGRDFISTRSIPKNQLVYTTKQVPVEFKVHEKENVNVDGSPTYNVVGWQAEKWVATKDVTNKIAKLTFEMGKDDKKTLTTGETWALGAGYELTINAIDARTTPRQVWMTLKKDGAVIDEGIGQAPTENTEAAKTKAVYFKKKTILGDSDALLFTVYISNIFPGYTSDMVQFQYAWLIDENSAKEIKSDDTFGVFKVRTTDPVINMDNENTVSLSKNSETTLMGNMKFNIADNDTLRFDPFVQHTASGTYESRGTVVQENTPTAPVWNAYNFAGFFYDIKYDRQTEQLSLDHTVSTYAGTRSIPRNELKYTTYQVPVEFKVHEKENVNVDGSPTYDVVGWQAEKWVATKDVTNKIAKLTFEMGKEDKKTLTTGETWALGAGYELTINAIDARTTPKQVWMTLKKDGAVIDEGIGQAPTENTEAAKSKAVYFKKKTILGDSDVLLFTIYISNIFPGYTSDMVQFQDAWLIDENSAKEIKSDDTFGVFKVRTTDPVINMDNENTVSLSQNSETTLMGNMKFVIADNKTLRFYPKVDYVIEEPGPTPTPTPTVTRSFSASTVASGATVTITIIPTNLPAGAYYTYETIPAGFTFVSTTAFGYSNVGNVYTFKQKEGTPFIYTLKATFATGTYTFSGTYKDIESGTGTVGGANQITVVASVPSVSISTGKSSYKPGDRMIVGLNLTNPGAITTVKASVWVDMPGEGKHMVMDNPSLSLPAGLKYSTKIPITLPKIPSGNYAWHAVLINSKGKIISESVAPWTFIGMRVGVESFETVLNNVVIDIE